MKSISEKKPSRSSGKRSAKKNPHKAEELKTDPPISEKDEVKKAEQRLQNNSK
jgi:hypothetical protein